MDMRVLIHTPELCLQKGFLELQRGKCQKLKPGASPTDGCSDRGRKPRTYWLRRSLSGTEAGKTTSPRMANEIELMDN